MPKGVEHTLPTLSILTLSAVNGSEMPKGVEHKRGLYKEKKFIV